MLDPTAYIELSIENLDQIYSLLQDSHEFSKSMLDIILVIDDNISSTDQNRKLLHDLLTSYKYYSQRACISRFLFTIL